MQIQKLPNLAALWLVLSMPAWTASDLPLGLHDSMAEGLDVVVVARARKTVDLARYAFPEESLVEARAWLSTAPPQAQKITGRDGAPMVLVPAGTFLYGVDNRRRVLPAYVIDAYEVTTRLYAVFLGATGREAPPHWDEVRLTRVGDRPVVGITWHDADAYCRYYGKRLPTEEEWEKAARGTDGRKYPWGNEEPTSRRANFHRCCDFKDYEVLVAVGSLEDGKSPYGIYEMAGNVWEWTSSDYDSYSKVLRGGSWTSYANHLETTIRHGWNPAYRLFNLGFRCAQDAS